MLFREPDQTMEYVDLGMAQPYARRIEITGRIHSRTYSTTL